MEFKVARVRELDVGAVGSVIAQYRGAYGRRPSVVVAHPKWAPDVLMLVRKLGLDGVQVRASGGCLVGELWLGCEEETAPAAPASASPAAKEEEGEKEIPVQLSFV